jgi:3-oxoacyl-[acyl-carrier protein] reductase
MVNTSLAGKVVIVTGGASGIGLATASRFLAEGARVVIADRNGVGAKQAADDLAARGGEAFPVAVDVTAAGQVAQMVDETERRFGAVQILSHNAGLAGYPTPALDATEDEFDRIMAVNVKGAWLCARAVAPSMQRAGGGSIVLVGSVMGERARNGFGAYASSKAATNHLARTLALEWAPLIRVNSVAPVATDTAMLPQFLGPENPVESRKAFIAGIPLGRLAQPEDIADATVFLASDQARFITGVVLPVDGGRSI